MKSSSYTRFFKPTQSTQDYFPFGSLLPGRGVDQAEYKYGFNSKENDNEVYGDANFQDYGMRMYDTRVGRFVSADPLIVSEQKYPELSPYQFASNRPIDGIDLDGLEWSRENDGTIVFSAVLTNTSGVDINLYMARQEIVNQFNAMFGSGFRINIRVDYSPKAKAKDGEAMIVIQSPDNFDAGTLGKSRLYGRLIRMNSDYLTKEGKTVAKAGVNENSAYAEEIGHTGGLHHPFEGTLDDLEKIGVSLGNFMSYPQKDAPVAISQKYSEKGEAPPHGYYYTQELYRRIDELFQNPQPASIGQKKTIGYNLDQNLLNQGDAD